MSQLTTFINELQPLVSKYQIEVDGLEIMKTFITTTKELFQSWQETQNKEQSICGAQIPFGELTFQCFTCAPDPHHMFCYNCFNPQQHINHKSIIKHDIGGACDCGDEQTIKESGFCKNHKGFSKMDQQGELAKIPQQLKTQIENFIKACCQIYIPLMKYLRLHFKKYPVLALQLYNVSERLGSQDFKNIIDSEINLEEYYRTFQQALQVHEILFSTLSCLIEERFCFILLITSILREKLTENSQDSIIEEIIENLVLLETSGPRQCYRLEKFFFSLFADSTFKEFMQEAFLKKNQFLWLYNTVITTQEAKFLREFIEKIQTFSSNMKIQLNQDFVRQISIMLENYLQNVKKEEFPATYLFTSEVLELHTQYVSEKLQLIFFSNPYIRNLYKQIKNNLQIIQIERINSVCQVMQFEPLNLRIEYEFFDKIVFINLKKILGENYETFMNQSLKKEILEKFPLQDFFLTALVDCASNLQPIKIDLQDKELTIGQEDHIDAVYYLMQQSFYIKAVQAGLSKIINSEYSTPTMIENINIVLLNQCYNQLKNGRNKKVSVDAELQLALEKYIFNQQLRDKQIFDRMSKIYLMLIKSDTYTDKVFILILCNLYCLKQFKSGEEFKLFVQKSLNEDINELQRQFYFILTRCIQTYTSIQYCQNQYLENVYLGLNSQQDGQQIVMLESFDTSFFRLHIFLFDQSGFADFIEIIKNRFIPLPNEQLRLLCSLILRMIGSDLDVYNVCSKSIKILPNDLKLSLAKLVQNFANLAIYQELPTIEAFMQQLGIMTSLNLPDHLLQVFEVDQSVKKLKLKSQYKPIYDPAIFHISSSITSQIVEKFIQLEKPQNLIQLGDGINWDVEQFSTDNYRIILKSILKFYCTKPYIDKNLQFLNFQGQFLVQAYQLIYIQIVASSYFRKEELRNEAPSYIKILEDIKANTQRKDDILRLNVLIGQIQNIIAQKNQQNQPENLQLQAQKVNSKQFHLKKSQLKAKFEALKNNDELLQQLEKIAIENQNKDTEIENCHSCRMSLFDQESSILILLFLKPATDILELHQQVLPQQLKNVQLDLAHFGISTCKHYFHKNCLIERFESSTKNVMSTLPDWVKLGCPICKQACIFTIPASKEISVSQANEFNQYLMSYLLLNEQVFSSFLEEPQKCLLLTYFSLFFDLITSLIQSPADFKRDQKYIVFNQLLKIFQQTCKEQQKEQFEFFKIPTQQDSLISKILKIIYDELCISADLLSAQNQIQQLLQISNLNGEYNFLIQKSFQLTTVNFIENNNNENGIIFKEIQFYSQLTNQIVQTLKMKIGNNFQDFYFKYFTQGCSYCGFYNKKQRGNVDFSLCLLCLKCFCHYSCLKKQIGNLNHHSKAAHSGNSIFVSLRTGNVTIVSSPISISHFKCLFYNQLGQTINVQYKLKNWETYMIDLEKIKELAIIIQNNNYQTIVRNLEVRQNQLDLNGLL